MFLRVSLLAAVLTVVNSQFRGPPLPCSCSSPIPSGYNIPLSALPPAYGCASALPPQAPCGCGQPLPALASISPCGCGQSLPALASLVPYGYNKPLPALASVAPAVYQPNLGQILSSYDSSALQTLAPSLASTIASLSILQNPCGQVAVPSCASTSNIVLPSAASYEYLLSGLPQALPYSVPLAPSPCGCQEMALSVPSALVSPFLPAASPVSALAPPVSSLLPPAPPCGCGSLYLRKIPIPPPCI